MARDLVDTIVAAQETVAFLILNVIVEVIYHLDKTGSFCIRDSLNHEFVILGQEVKSAALTAEHIALNQLIFLTNALQRVFLILEIQNIT